jgi:hypothetical protein
MQVSDLTMAFSSRRRCCCFITLVLLLFTSLVSSEGLDVLIPYVDTTQIPEEYFDWPLYLKFDVSWNEKPEAIIQGYISGATSIWSEALQVYPQEQPLRIETPACSELLTDTTSFEGPDIVLFISLTQNTGKYHNKPLLGSPCTSTTRRKHDSQRNGTTNWFHFGSQSSPLFEFYPYRYATISISFAGDHSRMHSRVSTLAANDLGK